MPGAIWSVSQILSHLTPQYLNEVGITALSILQVREVKHKRLGCLALATVHDISSSWIVRSMDNKIWCFSDNRHSETEAGREKQR